MKGADGDAERYHKAHDDPSFQVEKRKGAILIPFCFDSFGMFVE